MTSLPSRHDHPITNAVIARAVQSGVSAGVWRVKVWLALFACVLVAAIAIAGCKSKLTPADVVSPPMQSIDAASEAAVKAEAQVGGIEQAVPLVRPHVASPGIPLLDWIGTTARDALANLAQVKVEHAQAKVQLVDRDRIHATEAAAFIRQLDAADKRIAELKRDPFYVAGQWIRWGFWGLVVLLSFGFIARILSSFVGGWTGTALAVISTFILGLFTGGLSWFQAFFDNRWARDMKPKAVS